MSIFDFPIIFELHPSGKEMQITEIIRKKRDGESLSEAELNFFVDGFTGGKIPDYQASALLMAIFINRLSVDETFWLLQAMLNSGEVMDLSMIPGIKVDKHSTGGVGDKTSLILAPVCAAAGVPVPMISGRGLGHSGGTLDKLESIPGFRVDLDLDHYKRLVGESGLCLIGQTKEIAPADKKIYALRDVTHTVENKSLISASIMSKKLAEGIDALVLDVKTGQGAFMKTQADAEELAEMMISIGSKMGKQVRALITDMNQPLGSHVGNALEVVEVVELLQGKCTPEQQDCLELSLVLAAHMIVLGGKADDLEQAREIAESTIRDLSAFAKFKEIVAKQFGDPSALEDLTKLPTADHVEPLTAESDGYLGMLDALAIGKGCVLLGAGRRTLEDVIDPAVGVIVRKKLGNPVTTGDTILEIHYNDPNKRKEALPLFQSAIKIDPDPVDPPSLIKKVLV